MALKAPLLLASLAISGTSFVHLPGETDLSDGLILRLSAATLTTSSDDEGTRIAIEGMTPLKAQHFVVPGDPVFAAFPAVAALIAPDSEIAVEYAARSRPSAWWSSMRSSSWAPTSP